jgi:hypothetical protein
MVGYLQNVDWPAEHSGKGSLATIATSVTRSMASGRLRFVRVLHEPEEKHPGKKEQRY